MGAVFLFDFKDFVCWEARERPGVPVLRGWNTHTHLPHPVCTLKGEIKTLLIPCCRGDLGVEQTGEQRGRMIPPSENRTGEGKLTYGKGH